MNYINPPAECPEGMSHHTFYSKLYRHELGFCIYLPKGYETGCDRYPVFYHLHGWTGNESSEIQTLQSVCQSRNAITVFPNSSPVIEDCDSLPVEEMLIQELIPLIDTRFRTLAERKNRGISGFSMGGGTAMYYAVRHPELFSSVTAYAGTYHHYFYYTDFRTVGAAPEQAQAFYQDLLAKSPAVAMPLLPLAEQNAAALQHVEISLHIGTKDVLYCDNEIFRLHLERLKLPHTYQVFEGAAHDLKSIL